MTLKRHNVWTFPRALQSTCLTQYTHYFGPPLSAKCRGLRFSGEKGKKKKFGGRYPLCWVTCLCCDKKQQLYEKYHTRFYPNKARTQGGSDSGFQVILLLNSLRSRLTGWWQCDGTLCRFPLESPRKAMVCPALTLTATAVRRADGLSSMVSASTATLLAMGLGVWSEPQG